MSDFVDVGALNEEQKGALRRLILRLADSKRLMGIRYSDWILGAPSLETGIATSSMTQDEWGHARLLYAMLKQLGDDPVAAEHDRAAEEYGNLGILDAPAEDWATLVSAMVIADGALSAALRGFATGTFEPAANRVPKMLSEEEFHVSLGKAWYGRLAEASDEAKALLRTASEAHLPVALAWLGTEDSAGKILAEAGVTTTAVDLVADFKAAVRDTLAAGGVDIDAAEPSADWDDSRGRGSGCPDQDSIERARGDRNRALLVE
ncbi:MAG: Phenylacetic acid catabolic protein [Longimicrobiales bacterium]|jgi:phenylacetate-CoA oxygenase PaaI subunit